MATSSGAWWDELPASGTSTIGYSRPVHAPMPARRPAARQPVRPAVAPSRPSRPAARSAAKRGTAMGGVVGLAGVVLLSAGGYVVYGAVTAYRDSVQAAEAPMPMPAQDFTVDAQTAVAAAKNDAKSSADGQGASLEASAPHRGEIALIDHAGREVTGAPPEFCKEPTKWLPNRIYIPSMCVSAPVLTASAPDGSMQLPKNPAKLAWLSTTASVEASEGTSVISGHVNMWGKKGALYDLALMKPGTRIHVTDGYSRPHSFVVSSLKSYRKKDLPEDIFATTGQRQVALVTCGGKLVNGPRGNHYEDNVVAVAVPVPQEAPDQQTSASMPGSAT